MYNVISNDRCIIKCNAWTKTEKKRAEWKWNHVKPFKSTHVKETHIFYFLTHLWITMLTFARKKLNYQSDYMITCHFSFSCVYIIEWPTCLLGSARQNMILAQSTNAILLHILQKNKMKLQVQSSTDSFFQKNRLTKGILDISNTNTHILFSIWNLHYYTENAKWDKLCFYNW